MGLGNQIRWTVCCLFLSTSLFAAKITGKVTNGTTGKPASGEEVVLLSLAGGMEETARTKTDGKGDFTLDVPDEGVQHLIRVAHQGVNYFHPAAQGTTSADITVYDAARKVDNLAGEGQVFRVQTSGNELEVSEMYVLRNESSPPRTWMGERTFEIVLPQGAKLEQGIAAGPGGMPVNSSPVPTGKSNHYAFVYPIRPGRTQLQVIYKVPYTGQHDFTVIPDMPLAELGVMLPKSMHFNSTGESFSPATDEAGMTVFVAKSLSPGQQLQFSISGQGVAPREAQEGGGEGAQPATPGGGLGAPIGSPDPMSGSRWYILGGVVVIMAGFAVWMVRRKPGAPLAPASSGNLTTAARSSPARREPQPGEPRTARQTDPRNSVLDALKEELFQLETERLQGKISQQDYASAKAGLETLFRRQMKKNDETGRT